MATVAVNLIKTSIIYIWETICTALLVKFSPWRASYAPLRALLNSTEDKKDTLTLNWKAQKLSELTFVGIACALIASVISSSMAWPQASNASWATSAFWYGALILSLTAISSATQQGVALNRLSCYEDGLSRLRSILGRERPGKPEGEKKWDVRVSQFVLWQTPVMLLNFSILCFIFGLAVMLIQKAVEAGWALAERDVKIFILAGIIGVLSCATYVSSMISLYYQTHLLT